MDVSMMTGLHQYSNSGVVQHWMDVSMMTGCTAHSGSGVVLHTLDFGPASVMVGRH